MNTEPHDATSCRDASIGSCQRIALMCRQLLIAMLSLTLFALAGCSSMSPLNIFSGYSGSHKLTETARALRSQATEPQPLPRELDKHVSPAITVEPGDVVLVFPADVDSPV